MRSTGVASKRGRCVGMAAEQQKDKAGLSCVECGYALSGLSPSEGIYRCPECGTGMTEVLAARMVRQTWAVPSGKLNSISLLFCFVMVLLSLCVRCLSEPIAQYAWVLGAAGVVGAVAIPFWLAPYMVVCAYPRREARAPALGLALVAVAINLVVLGLLIGLFMLAVNGPLGNISRTAQYGLRSSPARHL
jgi:hypothetical protein